MSKKLCIYHGNCADGFTAAWVVKEKFGKENVDFHAAIYGEPAPDVIGRDVIIVDFSYKRDVMEALIMDSNSLLVLDHHKSAEEDLRGLDTEYEDDKVEIVFDMERSGAMIAWDYFNKGSEAPFLVQYVQDRDLWKFELPNSKEFTAALFSIPYKFKAWGEAASADPEDIIDEGVAILRKHNKDIAEFITANKDRRMMIAGHDVPVINVPYTLGSDTCAILCQGEPFAAYYYDLGLDRKFGLRSTPDGLDVSEVAASFGGGGHKNAAGFVLKDYNLHIDRI